MPDPPTDDGETQRTARWLAEGTLFPTRGSAIGWIVGLALFWSGGPLVGGSARGVRATLVVAAMASGAVLVCVGWNRMMRIRTGRALFSFWAFDFRPLVVMLESVMPWTLARAGRAAGINGPAVAAALYAILAFGLLRG